MMGSSAIDDELAEIESSAVFSKMCSIENNNCGEPLSTDGNHSTTAAIEQGTSPIMGPVDTIDKQDSYDNSGDLLVTFPNRADTDGACDSTNGRGNIGLAGRPSSVPAKQRNSISVNPMAMRDALAGLSDLVDSDDSDDEDLKPSANRNNNRMPSSPQPQQPAGLKNPQGSGGPEHRPLVGGFAAAAYEAARVDHYKKQGKDVRGHVVINSPAARSRRQHGQA